MTVISSTQAITTNESPGLISTHWLISIFVPVKIRMVEEGNAFEADVVEGVEDAKTPDVSEVKTREVPEDDVPGEYQDDEHVA